MIGRKIVTISEAAHTALADTKTGVRMKKPKTPAEREALKLRIEQAQRERQDFLAPKRRTSVIDTMQDKLKPSDVETLKFLTPSMDAMVGDPENRFNSKGLPGSSLTGRSIMEEIAEMELDGTVRPFVEGEPIGACNNGQTTGPAPALKTRNEVMEDRRKAMLSLRRRNDRFLNGER